MKRLAAFALVILSCVPATAQQPAPQRQGVALELLELEQDADKAILREALILQGRRGMKPAPDTAPEKGQFQEETAVLRDFIASKKAAITARADELTDKRATSRRAPQRPASSPADSAVKVDRPADIERYENANIEVQLLQAEVNLLQEPLRQAVEALARAEVDAGDDESLRPKAEEARKAYEKVKARLVERSTRLHLRQQEMAPEALRIRYERAARRPWLPVEPDPAERR